MTSQQLNQPQRIDERVEALENELRQLREMLLPLLTQEKPWWAKVAGSAEYDPTFDEATRLGEEWRKSN